MDIEDDIIKSAEFKTIGCVKYNKVFNLIEESIINKNINNVNINNEIEKVINKDVGCKLYIEEAFNRCKDMYFNR